jgi:dephospho-CoA kinase
MHPRIGAETRRQADAAGGVYQLIVVPLLVGSPLVDYVDLTLVVDCSEETQIKRLLDRDAETIDQAKRIVAAQASRADRLKLANDIIENDAGIDDVRRRVISLDQRYRHLATRSYLPERSPENS